MSSVTYPENWKGVTIENISSFVGRGIGPNYSDIETDVIAINQKCIRNGKVNIDFGRCHDNASLVRQSAILNINDICINSTGDGTIGRVGLWDKPNSTSSFFVDSHVTIVRPISEESDSKYLSELLSSDWIQNDIARYCFTGSTNQVELSRTELLQLTLYFPELKQQQKIAEILSTVDNLIDQTQNLIDKYTAVKQGMMADLFSRGIDLSGTPESNKNYGQLRPSYEEAPEEYQETELGLIPVSWEIVTLESISTVERGKFTHRPRDDERCYGGDHPFIQTGSVTKSQGGFITEYKQTLSDFGRNVSKEFPAGTIAVTIAANIADTGILEIPMCFPDSVVGVVVNNDFATTRFVEISIRRSKRKLDALAPLSAQKNINLEDLRPLKLALPNIEEQKELCRKYETQELLIQQEKAYLEKLNLKKKGLMQDLLTGKVKV
ncbi:restriction endonuclease subunit S [Pseudoalteromonas xiamenensis]|uniref:restriction endonuclease subunit S n=1 Tax=Pseudoalteromonas xiamenensis TaxID=882626 RepID=UPI0035EDF47A